MYIFSFRNLSDSVIGVDDTLGDFFGLFFAFVRLWIEAMVARVSALGSVLLDGGRESVSEVVCFHKMV